MKKLMPPPTTNPFTVLSNMNPSLSYGQRYLLSPKPVLSPPQNPSMVYMALLILHHHYISRHPQHYWHLCPPHLESRTTLPRSCRHHHYSHKGRCHHYCSLKSKILTPCCSLRTVFLKMILNKNEDTNISAQQLVNQCMPCQYIVGAQSSGWLRTKTRRRKMHQPFLLSNAM